jgi:phosphatidylserine/phosphatidylglycerophosphate/cardiolipin synthase-like enzyme
MCYNLSIQGGNIMHKHCSARIRSVYFLFLALALSACSPANAKANSGVSVPVTGSGNSLVQVYFTHPEDPRAADYSGGPDQVLIDAIDRARLSADAAIYSLNLWSIRNALLRAHRRGVVVRMVMESDNMDSREVRDLQADGIPIIGDQQEGLMHDKFIILDRSEVWTGSMNYTTGGVYKDNNNLICLHSLQAASLYSREFEQMFTQGHFGPRKLAILPIPGMQIGNTPIEIYFSPRNGVANHLLAWIDSARTSVYFLAFSFTSNDLGDALRQRAFDGVQVEGVMDDGQVRSNTGTEFDAFRQDGLDVRLDGNATGLMHHKVMIIDESIVIAGSYNFTNSAELRNDENLVILEDRDLAAQFLDEFRKIYNEALP